MEKHIMGENGISYTLGEDGLYYPDLYLPEETEYPIGKYGMLRKSYLKEHRKGLYLELVLSGQLNEHLHPVSEQVQIPSKYERTPNLSNAASAFSRSPDVAIAIGMFLLQNSLT